MAYRRKGLLPVVLASCCLVVLCCFLRRPAHSEDGPGCLSFVGFGSRQHAPSRVSRSSIHRQAAAATTDAPALNETDLMLLAATMMARGDDLGTGLNISGADGQQLQEVVSTLQLQLAAERARSEELQARTEMLAGEVTDLQTQLQSAKMQLETGKVEMEKLNSQRDELTKQVEALKASYEDVSNRLEESEGQTQYMKKQRDDLETQLRFKAQELDNLEYEMKKTTAELDEAQAKMSTVRGSLGLTLSAIARKTGLGSVSLPGSKLAAKAGDSIRRATEDEEGRQRRLRNEVRSVLMDS